MIIRRLSWHLASRAGWLRQVRCGFLRGLVVATCVASIAACGPEMATTVTGSMEGTTSGESEMSDGDETAWLVISGVVLALGVALTTATLIDEANYIERHQRDIERALAGGASPFPSDLAHALSLPAGEVGRVHGLLRERRGPIGRELGQLRGLGRKLAPSDLEGFWTEVLAALRDDSMIAPRLERLERRALELSAVR
jgi:hypothetical protein